MGVPSGRGCKPLSCSHGHEIHAPAMMRDKKQFYSEIVLGGMFDVPPSTLNKLPKGVKQSWEAVRFLKSPGCQLQRLQPNQSPVKT